ncbi:uncharacterized protein LOC128732062 [Anopheles nili]|uniref:uncharacterized protein LOC128732062 n=1 Tax=Anopheles nili TaxID=185578 RepID=UPI00237AB209|nr:uncharacterized protein LOC128732062 [Anopheles nili]
MVLGQLFAIASGLSIMTLAAIGLIYYTNRQQQEQQPHYARSNVSSSTRKTRWSGHDDDNEDIFCTICLEKILSSNYWTLPCKHSFHIVCISKWQRNKQECPNCRVPFS